MVRADSRLKYQDLSRQYSFEAFGFFVYLLSIPDQAIIWSLCNDCHISEEYFNCLCFTQEYHFACKNFFSN